MGVLSQAVLVVCLFQMVSQIARDYRDLVNELPLHVVGQVTVTVGKLTFQYDAHRQSADTLADRTGAWCMTHELPAECPVLLRDRVRELAAKAYARAPFTAVIPHVLFKTSGELLPLCWILALSATLWAIYLWSPPTETLTAVKTPEEQRRAPGIDLVRLFLAFTVLFSHAYGETGNQGIEPLGLISGGKLWLGKVALQLFFALGGYFSAASLQRRLQVGTAWRAGLSFLESRIRSLVPPISFFALITAGLIGPVFSSDPNYASDTLVWHFLHTLTAPFVINTETIEMPGNSGRVRGVPSLPGFERPPRSSIPVTDWGIAGSLHSIQELWQCYVLYALLACCCPPRTLRRASLAAGVWALCALASGSNAVVPAVAYFAAGTAFYGNLSSPPTLDGWILALMPPTLGLSSALLRHDAGETALSFATPLLLYTTLAVTTSPNVIRAGRVVARCLGEGGSLATHVWVWGSLVIRIVLRVMPGNNQGGSMDGVLAGQAKHSVCVRISDALRDSLESDALSSCSGSTCNRVRLTAGQAAEMRASECSVASSLMAFAFSAPATLGVAVAAERVLRGLDSKVFLAIAVGSWFVGIVQ